MLRIWTWIRECLLGFWEWLVVPKRDPGVFVNNPTTLAIKSIWTPSPQRVNPVANATEEITAVEENIENEIVYEITRAIPARARKYDHIQCSNPNFLRPRAWQQQQRRAYEELPIPVARPSQQPIRVPAEPMVKLQTAPYSNVDLVKRLRFRLEEEHEDGQEE